MDSPTVGTTMSLMLDAGVAAATGAAGAAEETTTASATTGVGAAAVAEASITQIKPPISTVSPSLALMRKVPVASAGNSKVALSDSNSQSTSSN